MLKMCLSLHDRKKIKGLEEKKVKFEKTKKENKKNEHFRLIVNIFIKKHENFSCNSNFFYLINQVIYRYHQEGRISKHDP